MMRCEISRDAVVSSAPETRLCVAFACRMECWLIWILIEMTSWGMTVHLPKTLPLHFYDRISHYYHNVQHMHLNVQPHHPTPYAVHPS